HDGAAAGNGRVGAEIGRIEQFGIRHRGAVGAGRRHRRQVDAVGDARGRACREEVVLELQRPGDVAGRVAGGRVDRNTFEEVAGAVDEVTLRVELEVAAARV